MFDFSLNAILLSLNIILPLLIIYYYYMPLRIPLKWIPIHIMACVFIGYLLTMMSHNALELYKNGVGWVIEVFSLFFMLSFCEGNICRNFIRYILATSLMQISVAVVLLIFHSNLQKIGLQLDYNKFHSTDIVWYDMLCVFSLFALKPLVCKLTPNKVAWKPIYQILTVAMLVESMIEIVMRSRPNELEQRIIFRNLVIVLVSAILILGMLVAYRRARQLESRQIENQQRLLSDAYENLWKENQNLHSVKHELTRHMRRVRSLEHQAAEQEWLPYVNMLKDEMGSILSIPCTGNLYVDSFMLQQYKKAEDMGIVLELVLEPLRESFAQEQNLVTILTELFEYVLSKKKKVQYMRVSVRTRCHRYLISMETGIEEKEYYRQKILDQIGDKMILRQAFRQTRYITENKDGGMLYHLETRKMRILVML